MSTTRVVLIAIASFILGFEVAVQVARRVIAQRKKENEKVMVAVATVLVRHDVNISELLAEIEKEEKSG